MNNSQRKRKIKQIELNYYKNNSNSYYCYDLLNKDINNKLFFVSQEIITDIHNKWTNCDSLIIQHPRSSKDIVSKIYYKSKLDNLNVVYRPNIDPIILENLFNYFMDEISLKEEIAFLTEKYDYRWSIRLDDISSSSTPLHPIYNSYEDIFPVIIKLIYINPNCPINILNKIKLMNILT